MAETKVSTDLIDGSLDKTKAEDIQKWAHICDKKPLHVSDLEELIRLSNLDLTYSMQHLMANAIADHGDDALSDAIDNYPDRAKIRKLNIALNFIVPEDSLLASADKAHVADKKNIADSVPLDPHNWDRVVMKSSPQTADKFKQDFADIEKTNPVTLDTLHKIVTETNRPALHAWQSIRHMSPSEAITPDKLPAKAEAKQVDNAQETTTVKKVASTARSN